MSQVAKTEAERRERRRSTSPEAARPGATTRSTQRQKKPTSVGPVRSAKTSKKKETKPKRQSAPKRTGSKTQRNQEFDKKLRGQKGERPKSASAIKAAERAQKQKIARRKMYLKVALAVIVVAGLIAGAIAVYNSSLFSVEKVTVTGTSRLTQEQVIELAQVPSNATLLRVPLKAIDKRVSADPWVGDVSVTRKWPNAITIKVTERTPAAAVKAGQTGEPWIISSGAQWLQAASTEDTETLVNIEGPMTLVPKAGETEGDRAITNALAILKDLSPKLGDQVAMIKTESVEKTELITKDGVSIYVGSASRLEEKEKIALETLKENEGKVIYINVRVPEHPTWRGKQK